MKRIVSVFVVALGTSVGLMAQQHTASGMPAKKMDGDAAKVQRALAAGPADMTKGAAVVEVDAKGAMHELRKGTNGWTCMLLAVGGGASEAMCGDKPWMDWGDAYMAKKPPTTKTLGVAYMLKGDNGASNTDPYANGPTATNDWVVSPAHLMLLVPDSKMLDGLPTDPHVGGPFVMWKGTPYAHIMVPIVAMPSKTAKPTSKPAATKK
jgi:hypothetical protein